jgi:hypothetical protein
VGRKREGRGREGGWGGADVGGNGDGDGEHVPSYLYHTSHHIISKPVALVLVLVLAFLAVGGWAGLDWGEH